MAKSTKTMTTGEVAAYLGEQLGDLRRTGGYSRQTVRRLIDSGELTASWSRSEQTEDLRGRTIRGHRRVTRASVEAFVRRVRQAAESAEVSE